VVPHCGCVLMIDDPLSLLSLAVWLMAAGMYPLGFLFGSCSECCCNICWVKWQSVTARSANGVFEVSQGNINISLTSDGPVFLGTQGNGLGPNTVWQCPSDPCLQADGSSLFFSNTQGGLQENSRNKTYSFSIDKPVSRVVLPIYSLGRGNVPVEFTFSRSLKFVKKECPPGDFGSTAGLVLPSSTTVRGSGQSSIFEFDDGSSYSDFTLTTGNTSEFYALLHIGIPCDTQVNPLL
jgi:hypothetical protein